MTGSGTSEDPYIISDVDDLQAMENNLSSYYELGGNIDASATSGWNGGAGFVPIGRGGTAFSGQLDGKGYTISGLFINLPTSDEVGLFGILDNGAVLKNISLTGVNITGDENTGALFGYSASGDVVDIDDCNSAGVVAATENTFYLGGLIGYIREGTVDGCWSSCTVTATYRGAGGLIGYNYGATITKCYATGNVIATNRIAGGLIGSLYNGSCSQCYATGNATSEGGFVGGFIAHVIHASATIDDCYARGNATGSDYVGGFVGFNQGAVFDDCYSTGVPTADYDGGGFIGYDTGDATTNCFWDTETSGTETSDGGTGKTTAQMKTRATFADAGWDI